jgi:hypothetical protein
MNYSLSINQHNIKPHLDIEADIQAQKNGLFTFNLRVNQSCIEDYAKFETITIKDYAGVEWTIKKERGSTYHTGATSDQTAIRPNKR